MRRIEAMNQIGCEARAVMPSIRRRGFLYWQSNPLFHTVPPEPQTLLLRLAAVMLACCEVRTRDNPGGQFSSQSDSPSDLLQPRQQLHRLWDDLLKCLLRDRRK